MNRQLAMVSGATGGIGCVVTERLWTEGYSILALGKTPEKCLVLQDWFLDHPRPDQHGLVICLDLTCPAEYALIERVLAASPDPLRLLATCHGAAPAPGPAVQDTTAIRVVYETDVLGTFALCQLAGRYMMPQRQGSIVLVSSLHARQTYPERVPYCVAKHAVVGLCKSLAVEWGIHGVRTNVLLPWQVHGHRSDTFIQQAWDQGEDLLELYQRRCPMRQLIRAEDIADAVVFLASNAAMNGCEIVLDRGVSSSMWYEPFLGL